MPEQQRLHRLVTWGILLLALGVRLPGLFAPLFVDEGPILKNISHFISDRSVLPIHFSYPPLYSYLATPATGLTALIGGWGSGLGARDWALLESAFGARHLVLGGRILTLLLSVLGVWLAMRLVPRDAPPLCRAIAGLAVALSPAAITYGVYALPDVPAGCAAVACVGSCLVYTETPRRRSLVLAGALAGVAAAFKYNGALAVLPIAVSAFLSRGRHPAWRADLALAAVACVAAFLLLAPTWLLMPKEAWAGFLFESRNVATARLNESGWSAWRLLRFLLQEPAVTAGVLIGIGSVLSREFRTPRALVLLAMPLASLVVIGGWAKQDANYFLPVLPVAALLLAEALAILDFEGQIRIILAPVLVAHAVFYSPVKLPPYSVDKMAVRMVSEEELTTSPIYRLALYTPKVWDLRGIEEFMEGRGASLTPAGKRAFADRLIASPRARRVVDVWEQDALRMSTLSADRITSGSYVVVAADRMRVLLKTTDRLSVRDTFERDVIRQLESGAGWRLIHREDTASGPALVLYRKEETAAGE